MSTKRNITNKTKTITFGEVARRWLAEYETTHTRDQNNRAKRLLFRDLNAIGDIRVSELTRHHIWPELKSLLSDNKRESAIRAKNTTVRVLDYAIELELITVNPAVDIII